MVSCCHVALFALQKMSNSYRHKLQCHSFCRGAFPDNDDKGDCALVTRVLETLTEFSHKYSDTKLTEYLKFATLAVYVHTDCLKT